MQNSEIVLTLTNLYPPQELGGYGRSLADFADSLKARGHQVYVLTSNAPYLGPVPQQEEQIDRRLQLWGTYEGQTQALQDPNQISAIAQHNDRVLREVIAQVKPDLCLVGNISFLGPDIFVPLLENQIPTIHHLGFAQAPYAPHEVPQHPLYHLATASDAVAQAVRDAGLGQLETTTIYPGALVRHYSRPTLPPRDKLRILYAGLVIQSKGAHTLLESLTILQQRHVDFECTIAGNAIHADYRAAIQQYLQQTGLVDRVRLVGHLERSQLADCFAQHNVFVFPSIQPEAFGIVQVEAMAAGLTVLSTGVGGASEVIEHGLSGLQFPPGDAAALAQALLSLPQDPDRWAHLAANGQAQAFAKFDIERSVDQLELKFEELLRRKAELSSPMVPTAPATPATDPYVQWLCDRLSKVVQVYKLNSSDPDTVNLLRELRRQCAEFWQTVPPEQLQSLYQGAPGQAYRSLLTSGFQTHPLTETETAYLQTLTSQAAQQSLQSPAGIRGFLGVMLHLPAGKMKVEQAHTKLPAWLLPDYQAVFESPEALTVIAQRQSSPSSPHPIPTQQSTSGQPIRPEGYADIAAAVESVEGWLVPGQEQYLFEKVRSLPNDATIVEIGSFRGRSTVAMAFACVGTQRRLYCIDTWDGNDSDFPDRDFFEIWQANVGRHGLLDYVVPLRGYSSAILAEWQRLTGGKAIDLIFIDGCHQYEDVLVDFQKSFPWVKTGGWVLFHDNQCGYVGVDQVWDTAASKQLVDQEFCSTIAAGRKPSIASSTPQSIESISSTPSPFPVSVAVATNLAKDTVFLNRMRDYINLYRADPNDQSATAELQNTRRQLTELLLAVPFSQLESYYAGDFRINYLAFLNSNYQRRPLCTEEELTVHNLVNLIGQGIDCYPGLNALMAIMMYLPPDKVMYMAPGKMPVRNVINCSPQWLLPDYKSVIFKSVKENLGARAPLSYSEIGAAVEAIEGWLDSEQARYLFEKVQTLPHDATIVEIGSYRGRSTAAMAFACLGTERKIYCIDSWNGNELDFTERDFLQVWNSNVASLGLLDYCIPLQGYSDEILKQWSTLAESREIDLIFIDGCHQYDAVMTDFQQSFPWVKQGGWVVFHDTRIGAIGVDRVWEEAAKERLIDHEFCLSISAGRKPILPTEPKSVAPSSSSSSPLSPPPANVIAPSNLAEDMVFLNRMLGCANLYYIDPDEQSIVEELRPIRRQVAEFWLSVPNDRVEAVFQSEFGKRYRSLLQCGFQNEPLTEDETAFVQALGQRVAAGIEQPDGLKAFLGVMLYYPPGKMQVRDAATRLPSWLWPDYQAVFEVNRPEPLVPGTLPQGAIAQDAPVQKVPDPTVTPAIAPPPTNALDKLEDRVFLNRLLGLTNLYEIDPTDTTIAEELREMRSQVTQLWLSIPDDRLEATFNSEFGRRYGSYLRSGFQREALTPEETQTLQQLAQQVAAGLEKPAGVKAFLGAMMYYPPGKMKVSNADQRLPGWLLPTYRAVFEEGVALPT